MARVQKMDIISKLHQPFVVEAIRQTDWQKGSQTPLVVELDPTAVCDLACPGCISEDIIAQGNSFSSQRLLSLGRELKESGVKGVVLIGGGEPLAHPAIGELITYFGQNDIALGITTNGTFIDRYLEQIATFSHWTRVSIDAASEETFLKLRPSKKGNQSKFHDIIDNMKRLALVKKGKLGFSFLIRTNAQGVASNVHEIYHAACLAKEIGCDYFEIKPSYNYKNGAAHTLSAYPPMAIEEIKRELERIASLADTHFAIIKAITLDDALTGTARKQPKTYHFCPVAELRTLITPSGVYVCPYWRGKSDFLIGDVQKTSFKELWHGEQKRQTLQWLDPSKQCATLHCLRHESNLEILRMVEQMANHQPIEQIEEFDRFI